MSAIISRLTESTDDLAAAEEAARAIEELDEEHSGEEGLFAEAKTDKGNLTAKSVKDRLKKVEHEKEAEASRAAKEAKTELDTRSENSDIL
jgi:hypothetical protein